tara:strand:- start:4914 stop:5537 length:624 start_codon:yes stop_codon:yes gene_type:complete
MPSIIQADQLKSADGVTTYLNSGTLSNITFPTKSANTGNTSAGGHVLQVQQKVKTDEFSVNPGVNNTFTAITGLDVKITPSSTSSKILVSYHINISQSAGSHTGVATALYRGGSIVSGAIGTSASGTQNAVTTVALHYNHGDANAGGDVVSMQFLDSPGVDTELTYQPYLFNASGSAFVSYVNRPRSDTNDHYITKGASFITAMEIA